MLEIDSYLNKILFIHSDFMEINARYKYRLNTIDVFVILYRKHLKFLYTTQFYSFFRL